MGSKLGAERSGGNDTNASRKEEEDPLDGSLEIIWVGWGCDTVDVRDGALVDLNGDHGVSVGLDSGIASCSQKVLGFLPKNTTENNGSR